MSSEAPDREAVRAHLIATGCTGQEAIAALAPDMPPSEHRLRVVRAATALRRALVDEGLLKPLTRGRKPGQGPVLPVVESPAPVVRVPEARSEAVDLLSLSPAAAAAWTVERLRRTLDEADPASNAYVAAAKQMTSALDRFHELRRAEEKPAPGPADRSPAEWREQLGASARELVDVDLEVYVAEWLGRKRLRLMARSDGTLVLERA